MKTNWRDFGIGMASGIAFCFVLYFGWGLISPKRPDTANGIVATSNAPVGMDENALIAANAERPNNSNTMTPPPQLRPEPRNEVEEPRILLEPEPRPEPPVVRPRPRPDPDDDFPPEDLGPDDEPGGKPDY
ncbi:MAG TPA: hypothetical protein VMG08_10285 [Allosphingosinicella sp.]|nr:hypothetical protein [Allosphingosinicella sp.]